MTDQQYCWNWRAKDRKIRNFKGKTCDKQNTEVIKSGIKYCSVCAF